MTFPLNNARIQEKEKIFLFVLIKAFFISS